MSGDLGGDLDPSVVRSGKFTMFVSEEPLSIKTSSGDVRRLHSWNEKMNVLAHGDRKRL